MLSTCHYMLRGVVIVAALRLFAPPPLPGPGLPRLISFFHSRPDFYQGAPFPTRATPPLGLAEFSRELYDYPNPQKQFGLDGIRDGFHVGFQPTVTLRSHNLTSALDHQPPPPFPSGSIPQPPPFPSGSIPQPPPPPTPQPTGQSFWRHSQAQPTWQMAPDS